MDNLAYTYIGNQLQKVGDSSGNAQGFKDGNTQGNDYDYDPSGNMTLDKNKSIDTIKYNHLNLPTKVIKTDGQYIRYIYDAVGSKLAQEVYNEQNELQKRTDYIGEYIYELSTNRLYASDFSNDTDGFTSLQATIAENVDGIGGIDDNLKITSTANQPRIRLDLGTDETGRTFNVSLKVYVDSNEGNIATIRLRYPKYVFGQNISITPNQWNTVAFDNVVATGDSPWELFFRANGNTNPTIGSKAYIKDLIITEPGIESDGLAFIQHEEGRIVPNPADDSYTYEYNLKDHLGNTRVSFTTRPKTHEFTLNYESDESNKDDQDLFEKTTNITDANIHDHTDNGNLYTQSQKLTGANNSIIGSVLTIPVGKGDQIQAEVYAKYLASTQTNNPVASIAGAVIGAITGSTGAGNYEGAIGSSFGNSGSMATNVFNDQISDSEPMAFINLMFLPEAAGANIANDHFAFTQVSNASNNAHAIMELEAYTAPANGYVVVYLSNESTKLTEVYFDDLKVTVNESKVIQTDSYFPFGLRMAGGFDRATAKKNRFLFNGVERVDDLGFDMYSTLFRLYDPAIGRFHQVDPLADFMPGINPYNFGFNNPISFADPTGLAPIWWGQFRAWLNREGKRLKGQKDAVGKYYNKGKNLWQTTGGAGFTKSTPSPTSPNVVAKNDSPFGDAKALASKGMDFATNKPDNNIDPKPVDISSSLDRGFDGLPESGQVVHTDKDHKLFNSGGSKKDPDWNVSAKNKYLTPIAEKLIKYPFLKLIIVPMRRNPGVYDGPNGDPVLNIRGPAIQEALIGMGVSPEQIQKWWGEYMPSPKPGSSGEENRGNTKFIYDY